VLAAFAAIALTRRQASRVATGTSVLGALAIVGAGFNGASFLNYGHAFSSMIMAGLWALALGPSRGGRRRRRPGRAHRPAGISAMSCP